MLNLKEEEERQWLAEKIAEKEVPLPKEGDQMALKLAEFARRERTAAVSTMNPVIVHALAKNYGIEP